MKKAIATRLLPFVVVLLMVLSMAACTSTTSPSAAPTQAPQSAAAASSAPAAAASPLDPYSTPIDITWAIQTAQVTKFTTQGDALDNNEWSRLIKQKLNINLKVAFSADSSTDAYENKLNTVIASGELPDIFKTQNDNTFLQLVQAGSLADLTSVWNTYATDSMKGYQTRFADAFKGVTIDGKLYAIPRMNDNFHESPFLWIRDDWLKYAGGQPPKTVEDLVAMAKKFVQGDPSNLGKTGYAFGLGLNNQLIEAGHASLLGLAASFGVPGYSDAVFYRDSNGKMTYSWINSNMKACLSLLHDMYAQGLINPEWTSKNESQMLEDWTNDKVGMAFGNSWGTWLPYNYVYQKEKVVTHSYPIPTENGYQYKVGIESNQTGQVTMVSATCKNPEAAVKILDLYDATVNNAGDPAAFDTYWNNEQYRFCPVYIDCPNEVYESDVLAALNKGSSDGLAPAALPFYNFVVGFDTGKQTDPNAYGTWGQMSKTGSLQWVLNQYKPDNALVQSVMGMSRPQSWLTNEANLKTLTVTTFTDIITGAKPADYFDTYVQQWLKEGGQQALDDMDKMYPAK